MARLAKNVATRKKCRDSRKMARLVKNCATREKMAQVANFLSFFIASRYSYCCRRQHTILDDVFFSHQPISGELCGSNKSFSGAG
jgi:hypothetical protein